MSDWHLRSEFRNGVNTGGAIQYVWMFGIIGAFVLLLACINFMNLSTARSERRAKEVGVRKTIGSRSAQLTLQFFSESLLTVTIAFLLSLLLVQLVLPLFNEVANKQMTLEWHKPIYWVSCISIIILTALVAGSYPAFYLSSFKPVQVLKGTFKAGRNATLPRKILVVTQFTVSVILIVGTVMVYRQIQFTKDRPVGYNRQNLITIPAMNTTIHDHLDAVKNELLNSGAIVSIAESESPTTGILNSSSGFSWNGKDPNLSTDFGVVNASYDYGSTIGWQVKEGRGFSRDHLSDSTAVVINETAAHFMGLKNPIGEVITKWNQPLTVIGVVKDMIIESPYAQARPIIYGLSSWTGNVIIVKLNADLTASAALAKIEQVFKKYNPEQPFEFQFVDEDYARKFGDEERIGKLAGAFTILAVLISCLGIFGLASFTAEQRAKEIGIRKILGASTITLWHMLANEFVQLVLLACIIAVPVAYYFTKQWLAKYAYRVEISWMIFLATAVSAIVITLLTISYQAIKTAVASPVKSLKSE